MVSILFLASAQIGIDDGLVRVSIGLEDPRDLLEDIERPLIQLSLSATRGNQLKAAQLLGLNRNTLRKKLRELDIDVARGLK